MTIVINGAQDIHTSGALRQTLLDAILPDSDVVIDLSEVGPVDLAFIQLVESARVQAHASGARLSLASPPSPDVVATLAAAGMLDRADPADAAFWTPGVPNA